MLRLLQQTNFVGRVLKGFIQYPSPSLPSVTILRSGVSKKALCHRSIWSTTETHTAPQVSPQVSLIPVVPNTALDTRKYEHELDEVYAAFKDNPDAEVAPSLIEACVSNASPNLDLAFSVYQTLASNSQPTPQVYDALVKACITCKQYAKAVGLWEEMYRHYIKPNKESFSLIAHACANVGSVVIARKMLNSLKNMPYNADAIDCMNFIRVFASHGQFFNAVDAWNYMEYKGLANNAATCIQALDTCAELGYLGLGEQIHKFILNNKISQETPLTNSILNMYNKCGQPNMVLTVWDDINRRRPNTSTYVHVLRAYASVGSVEEAEKVTHFLTSDQKEDSDIASALIDVYAMCGKHNEVISTFSGIKTWSVKLTTDTYVKVVNACAATDNLVVGKQIHEVVVNDPTIESGSLYIPLLKLYIKCQQNKQVQLLWNTLVEQDAPILDSASYAELINACAHSSVSMGDKIYGHIMSSGVEMDLPIASALMGMYAKHSRVDRMNQLWQQLIQLQLEPDHQMYLTFLMACGKTASADIAKAIMSRIERHSPQIIDNAMLRISVKTFSDCQRPALVLIAWKRLNDHAKLSADSETYEYVLRACIICKNELGQTIPGHMEANNFVPGLALKTLIVSMYAAIGDIEKAVRLFEKMAEEHSSIDVSQCLSILNVCETVPSCALGELVHAYMVSRNVPLTNKTTTALLNMYYNGMRFEVVMAMWKDIFAPQARAPIHAYVITFKACAHTQSLDFGKSVHAHLITSGLQWTHDVFLAALNMYASCSAPQDAVFLWDEMSGPMGRFTHAHYHQLVDLSVATNSTELGKRILAHMTLRRVSIGGPLMDSVHQLEDVIAAQVRQQAPHVSSV